MEETMEKILEPYAAHAKNSGFQLNPDEKTVARVMNGLLENEKRAGQRYCPCRRLSGDPEEDRKKICPCAFHKEEIAKDGRCFCGLFVK
jgi:ferredoxin-thioredoxin reductase catalytic subunit